MIGKNSVRIFVLLGISLAILVVAGSAQAGKIDNSRQGTVVIPGSRVMWVADAHYAVASGWSRSPLMTQARALEFVESMNAREIEDFGYRDWRLASIAELRLMSRSGVKLGDMGTLNRYLAAVGGGISLRAGKSGDDSVYAWPVRFTALVGFDNVVVFATNSASFSKNTTLLTGSVVVNDASSGPVLSNNVELSIGRDATTCSSLESGSAPCIPFSEDTHLIANRVSLHAKAVVNSDVFANDIDKTKPITSSGSANTPLPEPPDNGLPIFEPAEVPAFKQAIPSAGLTRILVGTGESQVINFGDFGDITVDAGGTLTFSGGVYNVHSIDAQTGSQLLFSAPTEVRVETTFLTNRDAIVGPAAGSGITAKDITFYVAGANIGGDPADPNGEDPLVGNPIAAKIGFDNVVDAGFYVPNGTFRVKAGSDVTGAFLARDVLVEDGSTVTLDTFVGQPAVQNPNFPPVALPLAVVTQGMTPLVITLTGTDPNNETLTFSITGVLPSPTEGALTALTQVPPSSATVTYTATLTGDLPDSFGFRVTDSGGLFDEAVVEINAPDTPVDPEFTGFVVAKDIPGGFEGSAETLEIDLLQAVVITLVAFADVEDPECEAGPPCVPVGDFAFTIAVQPTAGTVTNPVPSEPTAEDLAPPVTEELFASVRTATVTYTAPATAGTTTFDYQACVDLSVPRDGDTADTGECDTATVTIDFAALTAPGPPTAEDHGVTYEVDIPVEIDLTEGTGERSTEPGTGRSLHRPKGDPHGSEGDPIDVGRNTLSDVSISLRTPVGTFTHPDPPTLDEGSWSLFECIGTGPTDCDSNFDITTDGAVCVSVTDILAKGDRFTVKDGGNTIGTTPIVAVAAGTEENPDTAFGDSSYSSATFLVEGAGLHQFTIETDLGSGFTQAHAFARVDSPGTAGFCSDLPDLIVLNLSHDPASPDSATTIEFTAEVKNIGLVSAGPSTLCFAIGAEGDCTAGAPETNFTVPSLDTDETFEVLRSQRFDEILVDTMFTNTAVANFDTDDVVESDETNNTTIDNYTVTAAVEAPTQLFATITTLPTSGTLSDSNNTPITIANTSLPDTMVTYLSSSTDPDFFEYTITDPSTGLTSLEAVVELGISGVIVGLACSDGRQAGTPPIGQAGPPFGLSGVACTLNSQCCSGVCSIGTCQ